MKKIKNLHFEQYMFVFMFSAVLLFPWIVTLINVRDLGEIIKRVGWKPLLISNLLSLGWGIANVLYLVCILKIGAALSGAILSALGMSVGIIVPMVLKGSVVISQCAQSDVKGGNFYYAGIGGSNYWCSTGNCCGIWKGKNIK
ncbi:MAG: hypothetical protein WKG06_09900 [Segetibacter sp.]